MYEGMKDRVKGLTLSSLGRFGSSQPGITCLLMVRMLFTKYRGANQIQLHFRSVKLVL